MSQVRRKAAALSTGALVMLLLGWVYDLAQRVTRLEARQEFFFGAPTPAEGKAVP